MISGPFSRGRHHRGNGGRSGVGASVHRVGPIWSNKGLDAGLGRRDDGKGTVVGVAHGCSWREYGGREVG